MGGPGSTPDVDSAERGVRQAESSSLVLTGHRVKYLECPQRNPWGPRDFVNRISVAEGADYVRLEIEMQRGDVIAADVESFRVDISRQAARGP